MNDRELLELAAKAIGGRYLREQRHGSWGMHFLRIYQRADNGSEYGPPIFDDAWNPLTDDGDALRLAVKLGFINPGQWPNPGLAASEEWAETGAIDWYAATRRAIVRAAAAIGGSP